MALIVSLFIIVSYRIIDSALISALFLISFIYNPFSTSPLEVHLMALGVSPFVSVSWKIIDSALISVLYFYFYMFPTSHPTHKSTLKWQQDCHHSSQWLGKLILVLFIIFTCYCLLTSLFFTPVLMGTELGLEWRQEVSLVISVTPIIMYSTLISTVFKLFLHAIPLLPSPYT